MNSPASNTIDSILGATTTPDSKPEVSMPEGKLSDKELVTYLCNLAQRSGGGEATITFKPGNGKTEVRIEDDQVCVKFGALRTTADNLFACALAHKAAVDSMKKSSK
jgi:hypothetical protein